MSGAADNFLARWSRRKQTIQSIEAAENCDADRLPEAAGRPASEPPDLTEPDEVPTEAAEPLPRIEDLTGDSDISAFLRKNVPQALKMAALRRVWSLDPAIRDYVGPAEYAYDYNTPGAIPGFGPSPGWDASTAAEYAQKIVNPSKVAASSSQEPARPAGLSTPAHAPADVRPGVASPQAMEEDLVGRVAPADPLPLAIALEGPSRASKDAQDSPPAPRHGGALPR